MRSMKQLGVLVTAVCALSAVGAATASANFTASATGTLHGHAEATQVFNTGGGFGNIECHAATITGTIRATQATEQEVTVHYSNCTAFDLVGVHMSTATFLFTTSGEVHLLEPITVTVTKTLFTPHCTLVMKAQTLNKVDYKTTGTPGVDSHVTVDPTMTGIHSTWSKPCGSGTSTAGTYTGASTYQRSGGGWVAFDG